VAVVQDPGEALYSGMPRSTVENVSVDHVLRLSEIPGELARLAREPVAEGAGTVPDEMKEELDAVEMTVESAEGNTPPGRVTGLTCPECHGAMYELRYGELIRFRCRVGHAYSADTLQAEQAQYLEAALWTALRALEENTILTRRLAERARKNGNHARAARLTDQAQLVESRAEVIRGVLRGGVVVATEAATADLSSAHS
jgi:two-component system chemotaxis response regulator CheB